MSGTARSLVLATAAAVSACADAPTSPHAGRAPTARSTVTLDVYTPTVLLIDDPTDMNDAGHVVGRRYRDARPYLQEGATLHRLTLPSGAFSATPTAINNRGNVTAEVNKPNSVVRGAYWKSHQAVPMELPGLGGTIDQPADVNDSGDVVGSSRNSAGAWRAFRWRAGRAMTDISGSPYYTWATGISHQGTVSGYTTINGAIYPFALFGGTRTVLTSRQSQRGIGVTPGGSVILGGGETWAPTGQLANPAPGGGFRLADINAVGRLAGFMAPEGNRVVVTTAYTWFNGVGTTLRYPGENSSKAIAVNACGSVLTAVDINGTRMGVLWTKATCDVGAPTV